VILIVAILLRTYAFTWGLPHPYRFKSLHPDEPAGVGTMLQLQQDPLMHSSTNRFAFIKGAGYFYSGMLAIRLAKAVGWIHLDDAGFPRDLDDYRKSHLAARLVAILYSLGTVVLAFACGRLWFGPAAGEIAAVLEAISPLSVLNAHWATPDTGQAFWTMLCLWLVARSSQDRRFLAAASLTAGIAGAFKYPGASALLMVWAGAWFLDPAQRRARLILAGMSLPLFVLGFLLVFPAVLIEPDKFRAGLGVDQTLLAASALDPLLNIIRYPWYLAKTAGALLPLLALAGVAYSLARPRRESWVILLWFFPYLALMTSSWFIVTRYAVPWMSVVGLLVARMTNDAFPTGSAWRRRGAGSAAVLAGLLVLAVTLLHLRTMSRPDPRDVAGAWLRDNFPPGTAVAVTPSHAGDQSFVVPVDPGKYRVTVLNFRPDQDASTYLEQPFSILAANERAWILDSRGRPESQIRFWKEVNNPERWEQLASFSNRPSWPGVLLRGRLPEDLYYLYQETRIYQRNR